MSEPLQTEQAETSVELSVVKGQTSGIFKINPDTGRVSFAPDTTFEQWVETLRLVKWAKHKLSIGMADCLSFGYANFGNAAVDGQLEQLEFEATFVKTATFITDVPDELRLPNLDADHFIEIAKADVPKERKLHWAKIASEQGLSASQLKFSMLENKLVNQQATRALQAGVVTIHGLRQQFDLWLSRVGGVEGIVAMEDEYKTEIMSELDAIVEVGEALRQHLQVPA